jgi:RNA polymerase sigma factor (sigma-70 family)
MSDTEGGSLELVERALRSEPEAVGALVDLLLPAVRRVAERVIRRSTRITGRGLQLSVDDLVQDCFELLFDDAGRVLRSWEPGRGLALVRFVELISERHLVTLLKTGKRNPWREDPTMDEAMDLMTTSLQDPEMSFASKEVLERLLDRIRMTLSPVGMELFEALFVHEQTPAEIGKRLGMSNDAIYAWKHRFKKLVTVLLEQPAPATADGGRSGGRLEGGDRAERSER